MQTLLYMCAVKLVVLRKDTYIRAKLLILSMIGILQCWWDSSNYGYQSETSRSIQATINDEFLIVRLCGECNSVCVLIESLTTNFYFLGFVM